MNATSLARENVLTGDHDMNAHTRVVPLLAALLAVLTLASSAWAESAWVLWATTSRIADGKPPRDEHRPVAGRASESECRPLEASHAVGKYGLITGDTEPKRANERNVKRTAAGDTFSCEGNEAMLETAKGPIIKWRYFCLPDTVDPRGPKASGR